MSVTSFGSDIGRNEMKSFYNNITIIPLILKNIKKKKFCIFLCCKAIHTSHIYSQQYKYCLKMQTNIYIYIYILKTSVMSLAKTKQNNISHSKTKVGQKIPHFFNF